MGNFVIVICLGLIVVLFGVVIGLGFRVTKLEETQLLITRWLDQHSDRGP